MSDFWRDAPGIRGELDAVREIIGRELSSGGSELAAPLSELGASEGKMLRPGLLIIASRFGSPDPERIRRIAAAVEMFHLATLVHDDVIDGASVRRRRPTLNARRGPRTAVLVGDFLFSRSFLVAAARSENPSVRSLSAVVAQVCASEIAQSNDLYCPSLSVRRYLRRIAGKTAALIAGSCHLGATESGCDERISQTLRRAGYCMGMAFQIVDDLLDVSGESERLGKPVAQDLREGVFTLPVVLALRRDAELLTPLLTKLRGRPSPRKLAKVIDAVRSLGGLEQARSFAERYTARALREIATLPEREERHLLEATAQALLERRA